MKPMDLCTPKSDLPHSSPSLDGPNGNGGEDADKTEYGQPVQRARDSIVGLWACSGHNVFLIVDLFGFFESAAL